MTEDSASITCDLRAGASSMGVHLTTAQEQAFARLAALLETWNERMNLSSIAPHEVAVLHFLDSLSVLPIVTAYTHERILDVGTGAGFPGLPLKIALPDAHMTLLDATEKKLKFVRTAAQEAGLAVQTVHGRAQELGRLPDYREQYDIAIARALADLPVLAELILPFVKVGGIAIAMKGPRVDEELTRAESLLAALGGIVEKKYEFELPFSTHARSIVVMKKQHPTPARFPRLGKQLGRSPR